MRDDGFRVPDWKDNETPSGERKPEETYYTYDEPLNNGGAPFTQAPDASGGPLRSVEAQTQGEFVTPLPAAPYEYYDEPEETPAEADLSGFTKAGFGARFCAWLLDGVISAIPGLLASGILMLFGGSGISEPVFSTLTLPRILFLAVRVIYRVATTALFGGTLGKLALKLKVISTETGREPTFWQCFFRETFGKYLSGICLGIGYLMAFSEKGTLHDRLADTAVVYDL